MSESLNPEIETSSRDTYDSRSDIQTLSSDPAASSPSPAIAVASADPAADEDDPAAADREDPDRPISSAPSSADSHEPPADVTPGAGAAADVGLLPGVGSQPEVGPGFDSAPGVDEGEPFDGDPHASADGDAGGRGGPAGGLDGDAGDGPVAAGHSGEPAAATSSSAAVGEPGLFGDRDGSGEGAAVQPELDELADPERLRSALEAVLLVVDTPTSSLMLAQVLGRSVLEVDSALRSLRDEFDAGGRGMDLREVADGWRLYSRDEFAGYVERFILDGQQARLTQASLETLAVIAYRQPVTRSRISGIRGVSVDAVMRTLLTRGLVEECGADPDTGGGLYRTTRLFLEKMGLRSLDELPSLAPLLPDTSQLDDVELST